MTNTKNTKSEVMQTGSNEYTSKQIKSLDGIEAVQLRPG